MDRAGEMFGFGQARQVDFGRSDEQSYCGRMGHALCGMCVGMVLFVASIVVLGWNEFNYVGNQRIILYVSQNVISAGCSPSQSYNNAGVFVSCPVSRLPPLQTVLSTAPTSNLNYQWAGSGTYVTMSSQIYGWIESTGSAPTGSQCKKIYSYTWGWVDSSSYNPASFHCSSNNPCCTPIPSYAPAPYCSSYSACFGLAPVPPGGWDSTYYAAPNTVAIGPTSPAAAGYLLNDCASSGATYPCQDSSGMLSGFPSVVFVPSSAGSGSPIPGKTAFLSPSSVTYATNSGSTRIGDFKVSFTKSNVQTGNYFSVIALQGPPTGSVYNSKDVQFQPWNTGISGSMQRVNWFSFGQKTKAQMISDKESQNSAMVWLLRFLGYLAMFLGLQLITGPIAVFPTFFPCGVGECLGEVVGCMLCCINFMIATALSLLVIAMAWLAARPLVGGLFLAASVLLIAGALFLQQKHRKPQVALDGGSGLIQAVATPQMITVICPQGSGPGQWVTVPGPNGQPFTVQVPQGVQPGQPFMVQIPH